MADHNKKSVASPIPSPAGVDDISKEWLNARLIEIEKHTDKDVLTIYGYIQKNMSVRIRLALEGIENPRKTVLVILNTPGGDLEETKVIGETLRHFYPTVHFLVPIEAMSAGTVLVMSGDVIYMDYFSRLGPIDPQILKGGVYIPALSYLRQYDKMVEKSKNNELTNADVVLLDKLDLAELDSIELIKRMSVSLIAEWLPLYKFKDWKVNMDEKRARAEEIAEKLNDQDKWFVHSHGIHKNVLEDYLKLKIDDYSEDSDLKSLIWKYFWALTGYAGDSFVHSKKFI